MKKMISIMMVFILSFSLVGNALADTLKMPDHLISVADEAFAGDEAVEIVDLPWGAQSIGSRAFADSGIQRIYIPDTVYDIGENAFQNTGVTIVSTEYSYAHDYAIENDILWEDASTHYYDQEIQWDQMTDEDYVIDLEHLDYPEQIYDDYYEEEDDEAFQEIYNEYVDEMNDLIWEYNNSLDYLNSAAYQVSVLTNNASLEEASGQFSMNCSDLYIQLDQGLGGAAGENFKITDISISENNSVIVTSTSGSYSMEMDWNGVSYVPEGKTARGSAIIDSERMQIGQTLIYRALSYAQALKLAKDDLMKKIEYTIGTMDRLIKKNQKVLNDLDGKKKLGNKNKKRLAEAKEERPRLERKRLRFMGARRLLNGIDIGTTCLNLSILYEKYQEIYEYYNHNHPNWNDKSVESIDLSQNMNKDIVALGCLMITDAVSSVLGLASTLVTIACAIGTLSTLVAPPVAAFFGVGTTVSAIISGGQVITGLYLSWLEEKYYNAIVSAHKRLHTYIYGVVTDYYTGKPLSGVSVTNGELTFITDSDGHYELYIPSNGGELLFIKESYHKDGFTVNLPLNEGYKRDIALYPEGIPVDEAHFPDASFREYINAHFAYAPGFLKYDTIRNTVGMTLSNVQSTEGIEYFYNLERITCDQGVVKLDVTGLEKLETIHCRNVEALTGIYASGCPALTEINAEICKNLTSIDVSGCIALQYLYAGGCGKLSSVNVDGCNELISLQCQFCNLSSIRVAGLPKLSSLRVQENNLTTLSVAGCHELTFLMCYNNQLVSIDLTGCTKLENFQYRGNVIKSIDLSGFPNLKYVD